MAKQKRGATVMLGQFVSNQNRFFIIFPNEGACEKYAHLFPNYVRMCSFGGYMNAIELLAGEQQ